MSRGDCAFPTVNQTCVGGAYLALGAALAVRSVCSSRGAHRAVSLARTAVAIACLARACQYLTPVVFHVTCASSVSSAFYPLVVTACSSIIYAWKQALDSDNKNRSRACYVASTAVLVTLNMACYSTLAIEVFMTYFSAVPMSQNKFNKHIISLSFASQLLILAVVFVIYGFRFHFMETRLDDSVDFNYRVRHSQLHQPKYSVILLAGMLFIIVTFLAADVFREMVWPTKACMPWLNTALQWLEVSCAAWFACALRGHGSHARLRRAPASPVFLSQQSKRTDSSSTGECWICLEGARGAGYPEGTEYPEDVGYPEGAGALVRACRCAPSHYTCLARWLKKSAGKSALTCKVCKTPYTVQEIDSGWSWVRRVGRGRWARGVLGAGGAAVGVGGIVAGAWLGAPPSACVLIAGVSMLLCYVALWYLSVNAIKAYRKAKISSLRIVAQPSRENIRDEETESEEKPQDECVQKILAVCDQP